MVFQYNPLAYYIETNKKGELLVTFARSLNISPKIRYNIHDKGHVIRYGVLKKQLMQMGKWDRLAQLKGKFDLPILFLYGRSDMSIDYYGANVTPDSVREVLYGVEELAPVFSTFRLSSTEDEKHNKNMVIDIELTKDTPKKKIDNKKLTEEVFRRLADMNRDFYNAFYNTATKDNLPKIHIHEFDTGPFKGGQRKLKNVYVETKLNYDSLSK
jgi:phenylacetate-CoA ligase